MELFSPAKINLFLQVIGKRSDGYHDLFSLMCPIGLHDTVSLETAETGISVSCNHPGVPRDESNLAWKAARLFFNRLPDGPVTGHRGVRIHIRKNIPIGGGLGGGSSNAAAVLRGLNRLFGHPFSRDRLLEWGLLIGADVPFFIFGKPAIAEGVGERLRPFEGLESMPVLLINPGIHISTADVYKNLDLGLTKCEKKLKRFLLRKQAFNPDQHLCNDLETVTLQRHPEISRIKKLLLGEGATGALMSGSGSTVFGIFSDHQRAEKARQVIERNKGWWIFSTELMVDTGCWIQTDPS